MSAVLPFRLPSMRMSMQTRVQLKCKTKKTDSTYALSRNVGIRFLGNPETELSEDLKALRKEYEVVEVETFNC